MTRATFPYRPTPNSGVWFLMFLLATGVPMSAQDVGKQATGRHADHEKLVEETHKVSLKLREEALRKTIAKDTAWPPGIWGDNLWCLSALYLNEKVDAANARLLKQANDYIDLNRNDGKQPIATPEQPGVAPWTFFSITDYVRTLCLFHSMSSHFPGRLKPETESAMKEALCLWVSGESRVADAGLDDLFLLLGTENHDLNRRPNHYLVTALLKDDPAYRERKLADGHTVAEHADTYTMFFREWPRRRAGAGLWAELGSNGYQKYSWPALFNLHELAPDPVIRRCFGLLLDLAIIEEEQISVHGRRGGGRSRAYPGSNAFESYKNLLYASEGQPAGSSHSRVIETSRYQLPPEAILLRKRIFPAAAPFVICNRVLGELEAAKSPEEVGQRLAADPALINYAYRTPQYLLGSTLQNPALTMPDPKTGAPTLRYAGISRQNRACGMLFDDPLSNEICAVYPEIGHGGGGRPQHSFWSVQHENVLILQRIAPLGRTTLGSYNTDAISIGFAGKALERMEESGWIFASNSKAFVGVKFLDGGYEWNEKRDSASPAKFDKATDKSRILLHAGDIASHGSFEKFKADVLASRLTVTPDKVDYQFGPATTHLEVTLYDAKVIDRFTLPLINSKPVDLRPAKTYQSPYLNGDFGSDRISVGVAPLTKVLWFSETAKQETCQAMEPDQAETPRINAWRDLHYGLFIHWNMNTFAEKETDYPSPRQYAPTTIDVDQWVRVARDAGMKYAVLTAKHNFGFCLWDSRVSWQGKEFDFDVAASGNKDDVVRLFLDACKKYQIVPGLYYNFRDSHANLVDGGKGQMQADYFELVKAHLRELTTRYPECHYYWIDRASCANADQFAAVYEVLRRANPRNIVLFNAHVARPWGMKMPPDFKPLPAGSGEQSDLFEQIKGFGFPTDIVNTEGNIRAALNPVAKFQSWQGRKYYVGYEHCARTGNGWGWFNNQGTPYPTQELFTMYQSVRRNGGNLLLNIGPAQTGRLDGQYVKTLMELKALIEPFEEQLAQGDTGLR